MHLLWSFMVDGKMRASVLFTFSLSRKIIGTATNTKPFSFRYKWFHVISLDTSTLNTYTWDDLVLLSWGWVLYLARTVCANGLKKHFLYMFFFFFLVSHINICIGTWPLCLEETSPRARSWNISKMHCFLNSVVRWKDLVLISVFILPLSLSLAFTQCQPPLALIIKTWTSLLFYHLWWWKKIQTCTLGD